ncbi:MAG: endo-1,4-beta-xylanase [Bacteroidales bacterium]|nr:endo-1,4-beta-xylanase [Bacteroidales bacterium]
MKKFLIPLAAALLLASCVQPEPALKDVFTGSFVLGAAINEAQISGEDIKGDSVLVRHFAAIEPENCLKSGEIMPVFGQYDWILADKYVEFGEKYGLDVYGHCLIWHSQCTPDFCYDQDGNLISPELLKERMKQHISTLMGRYKGHIKGWDVVNEAIMEDGSYRNSPFYQILGEEFIPWAFQCAYEADPECELYYNDYAMHEPAKLDAVIKMANQIKERGIRIDAIGFQGHLGMDYPDLELYEKHIRRVKDETGLDVCITELDMSILPTLTRSADLGEMSFTEAMKNPEIRARWESVLNPYPDGIPAEVRKAWNKRMEDFLVMFVRNSDVISRINVWGICDSDSWKNGWPIPERQDEPLWVDRDYRLKPFLNSYLYGR